MKAFEFLRYFEWAKPPEDVRLPLDSTEELRLEPALVQGRATFMPPDWAGEQVMTLYADRATITVAFGFSSVDVPVPLRDFRIEQSRAPHRRWFPKCATAKWELLLVKDGQRLTVRGTWLTLAWLGYLGEWDEPDFG